VTFGLRRMVLRTAGRAIIESPRLERSRAWSLTAIATLSVYGGRTRRRLRQLSHARWCVPKNWSASGAGAGFCGVVVMPDQFGGVVDVALRATFPSYGRKGRETARHNAFRCWWVDPREKRVHTPIVRVV